MHRRWRRRRWGGVGWDSVLACDDERSKGGISRYTDESGSTSRSAIAATDPRPKPRKKHSMCNVRTHGCTHTQRKQRLYAIQRVGHSHDGVDGCADADAMTLRVPLTIFSKRTKNQLHGDDGGAYLSIPHASLSPCFPVSSTHVGTNLGDGAGNHRATRREAQGSHVRNDRLLSRCARAPFDGSTRGWYMPSNTAGKRGVRWAKGAGEERRGGEQWRRARQSRMVANISIHWISCRHFLSSHSLCLPTSAGCRRQRVSKVAGNQGDPGHVAVWDLMQSHCKWVSSC